MNSPCHEVFDAPAEVLRVLLVDEDPAQRALILNTLVGIENICTQAFESALAAIALIEASNEPFDLVICNLDMTEFSGTEFVRRLALTKARHLILISSSGNATLLAASALAKRYGATMSGMLSSPVCDATLTRIIKRLFPAPDAGSVQQSNAVGSPWCHGSLQQALARGEFYPVFQPIVNIATYETRSVEVLARWDSPVAGMLMPTEFIPILAQHGLLSELFRGLLQSALRWFMQFLLIREELGLSINVSIDNLRDPGMTKLALDAVCRFGLDPMQVTFELTNASHAAESQQVLDTLVRLRLHGFGISIDDFGINARYVPGLNPLPISEIKIHKDFVTGAPGSAASAMLQSAVRLANTLSLRTVAEGIETLDDLEAAASSGCHTVQGNLFAGPMTGPEVLVYLSGKAMAGLE